MWVQSLVSKVAAQPFDGTLVVRSGRKAGMKSIFFGIVAICAVICSDLTDNDEPSAPEVTKIAKNYRRLRSMTTQPVQMDPALSSLCTSVSRWVEGAKKRSGPHAFTSIRIYMNEPAAEAFKGSAKTYPTGAVIVKEKSGEAYAETHDGVGGMVKRQAGFDSEHGDWEYFYFEDPAKIESGRIASCVRCHAGASQDHVFGSWARER
jgi:hypothetical protein